MATPLLLLRRRSRICKLLLLLMCLPLVVLFLFENDLLIYFGVRVPDTAPITWKNPALRNILVNSTLSKQMEKKVRILCVVPSTQANEHTKARAVNNTWGSRCNKLIFVFSGHRSIFNHISLNISDGRSHLTAKTMEAFKFVYTHYADDFDWVVKADDDSYLILENLRLLLSNFDPEEPAYLGFHFRVHIHNGYMSGGGSYVLSKEALRRLVKEGLSDKGPCHKDPVDEDVEVGRCMETLGVKPYITQDKFGRNAFHPNSLGENIIGPVSSYLKHYPATAVKAGPECCSQFSISFHYVPYDMMYIIDFLLYRVSVFGTVDLPWEQLKDVFAKKESKIKHNSEDEIIPIKNSYGGAYFLPQEQEQLPV